MAAPRDRPRHDRPTPRGGIPAREQDLAFLLLVSDELSRSLDLGDVLGAISRRLLDVVPAWRVGVLLLEGDGNLRLAAGCVRDAPVSAFPRGIVLERGRYPEVERALATRRIVEVSDIATHELMVNAREPMEALGLRTLLVIPLAAHGTCLGVLSLAQRAGSRAYTARERSLLQAVANQAAVALRNAQLFAQVQAAARELERKVEERTHSLAESHARLSVLTDITAAMNMGFDLERILSAALAGLSRLDRVERAQICLVDASARTIHVYEPGPDGDIATHSRDLQPGGGGGADGSVAGEGAAGVSVSDASGGVSAGLLALAGSRPHLLAPLVSKDGVIGIVLVFLTEEDRPSGVNLELLQQVAGELSIALERVELYRAAQRRNRQLEVISDIGRRVTQAVAVENLLQVAADLIRRSFDYSLTSILVLDRETERLVVAGASGSNPSTAQTVLSHGQPSNTGLCGAAMSQGRSINVPDVRLEPLHLPVPGIKTLSELVVPIKAAGGTVGVIDVQDDAAGAFTSTDVALLETLADQLAAAMQLSELVADLQRGRKFTEQVINNLTAGLIVTDRRRTVQVVNHRAADILRVPSDELVGRDLLDVLPTAAPLFHYSYEAVGRECEVTLSDGRVLPLGFSNSFFVDASERRDAVIITFRDLSEVRELQRKVRHAERLATIGTVAAGVAHEIRNPLFGISATAQILGREIPEGSPLRPLCQGMLDETRRVNDLVTNLVAYGRPQEPKLRPVDPDRLIEETIASVAARARESRCDVVHAAGDASADVGDPPRRIEADPDQVKQVLINLLLNAFDAAPGGTVRIGVTWDEPGGNVRLFVRDNGPGVPADQIDKVFDLFYTTKVRGSGMGLALSARIVQEHGGTIRASNPPDGGAMFEVRLPRRRVERREGTESPA